MDGAVIWSFSIFAPGILEEGYLKKTALYTAELNILRNYICWNGLLFFNIYSMSFTFYKKVKFLKMFSFRKSVLDYHDYQGPKLNLFILPLEYLNFINM